MWMKRYIKRRRTFFNRHQVNRYYESMVGIYISRLCFVGVDRFVAPVCAGKKLDGCT